MYDQFFRSLEPNVECFGKFLYGVLRRHDVDPFEFQLAVERCVWDVIKFDTEKVRI